MCFVEDVVSTVLALETSIFHAYARIAAGTDAEGLHDLRIAIRRIRSLLKPLGLDSANGELEAAAAAVGRSTTPIRDLEVMATELERRGMQAESQWRRYRVARWYGSIGADPDIKILLAKLDEWPMRLRAATADKHEEKLKASTTRRLRKQLVQLANALNDPGHDRHEIRLLVKRARYSQEAFPSLFPLPAELFGKLKHLQSALGDWHDRHQWCLRSKQEPDLLPLVTAWRAVERETYAVAEHDIVQLAPALAGYLGQAHPVS